MATEKNTNLDLWNKVEKTNPKYTKNANVKGNKITSITPQFQIKNVTEQFGCYGKTWGFKSLDFDYTLVNTFGLVVLNAVFFYPDGEFPIRNSISMHVDNAKLKVDDNFAKKLETDTLTKAISKLGFNADIFMGLFDDLRYVEDLKKEFNSEEKITLVEGSIQWIGLIEGIKSGGLVKEDQFTNLYKVSTELKDKLNGLIHLAIEERKPLITDDQYTASLSGTTKQIDTVIKKFRLTDDQKNNLLIILDDLNKAESQKGSAK